MQTLEEKFRILADAARDNSEIVVQELVFQGKVSDFVNVQLERHDLDELIREPAVSMKQKPANGADHQKYPLNLTERDAVLAGLRLLQKHMGPNLDAEIVDIMCDNGPGPSDAEIDTLCQKLNQW